MSNSSGRPTQRITEMQGRPPTIASRRKSRDEKAQDNKEATPRPEKVIINKPPKPPWRTLLPQWLRESEPQGKHGLFWIKWFLYARVLFALPFVKKRHESVKIPNFIDYEKGSADNSAFSRETRSKSSAIICLPAASGGVGKTTTSTLLGAHRRMSTDMPVIVYDGDTSDPNVFMWYDLDEERGWLTGASLLENLERGWRPSYNDMSQYAATEYSSGVMAIHAARGKPIDAVSTKLILDRLRPCVHSLICDTEPGTEEDEQTHMIVQTSDIVVVPGIASGAKELQSVKTTLDYEAFGLRDEEGKVAPHVIIAISGVKREDFNLRTRYKFALRFNATLEQIVLLPYSQYIKGDGNFDQINKIEISALDARMRYGVSCLDRAVSELAIELNNERRPSELSWNDIPDESLYAPSQDTPEHSQATSTS